MTDDRAVGLASGYLALQGVGAVCWWVGVLGWERCRRLFFPPSWSDRHLYAVALPDLAVFAALSVATATLIFCRARLAAASAWMLAGAAWYACFLAWGIAVFETGFWLGPMLMTPAACACAAICRSLATERRP